MTSIARRRQPAITIRSARAVDRLMLLTRDGRSQATVIEEALDRMPLPEREPRVTLQERLARIKAITASVKHLPRMTMAEFETLEYDENGDLR